jgi:hypothetical protein
MPLIMKNPNSIHEGSDCTRIPACGYPSIVGIAIFFLLPGQWPAISRVLVAWNAA